MECAAFAQAGSHPLRSVSPPRKSITFNEGARNDAFHPATALKSVTSFHAGAYPQTLFLSPCFYLGIHLVIPLFFYILSHLSSHLSFHLSSYLSFYSFSYPLFLPSSPISPISLLSSKTFLFNISNIYSKY